MAIVGNTPPVTVTPPVQADVTLTQVASDMSAKASVVPQPNTSAKSENSLSSKVPEKTTAEQALKKNRAGESSSDSSQTSASQGQDYQLPLDLEELEVYQSTKYKPAGYNPDINPTDLIAGLDAYASTSQLSEEPETHNLSVSLFDKG